MRRQSGFTLLEILIAIAIFAFIAGAAMQTMANSDYLATSAKRARELRMLAERKLGEILTFEHHYDEYDSFEGDFMSDYPEYKDRFKDWRWQLDIRYVTVFGISTKEDAQYFFGAPTDEEKAAAQPATGGSPAGPAPASKGTPQELRELTLRVSAPADDGDGDSVELIVLAPILQAAGTAAASKPK